jgi:DNA mismatch repair protein MutS
VSSVDAETEAESAVTGSAETLPRPLTLPYGGLLFVSRPAPGPQAVPTDSFLHDLNLDQIVESVAAKREDAEVLRAHLLRQLHDGDAIRYRQEVFLDLELPELLAGTSRFAEAMRTVRRHLTQASKMSHQQQRRGWVLDAAAIYCTAIDDLATAFTESPPMSRGLRGFGAYLEGYRTSTAFSRLQEETTASKAALDAITYVMRITPDRIDIVRSQGESDYSAEVEATFERFSQGAAKDYTVKFRGWPGVDRIGGEVLTMVAKLFTAEFAGLERWFERHRDFFDRTILETERELDFYLALRSYIDPLKAAGLSFCLPEISEDSRAVHAHDTFDLALASKIVSENLGAVVTNDFELSGVERIFVVSGPNQGGKTTFARTFGQLHHLASIGAPVPGSSAAVAIFDRIFTHFEAEEDLVRLSGKLEDDLVRVHEILSRATPKSIVILNEIFTSTALKDARYLGTKIMERLIELDLLCVFVTFVDEMASMGASVVSVMSAVVPSDPAQRTFRVVRAPADGLAHAIALAEKHGVTYDRIKERLAR